MKSLCLIVVATVFVADFNLAHAQSHSKVIEITGRRELFIDDFLLDKMEGTNFKLHHPQPAVGVLRFDKPWEGAFSGYVTVIKDGTTYRMYYRGLPVAGADGSEREVTCCAISNDGINWTKPEFGLHEYQGSSENNIVLMGETPASHNFAPFLDSNPDCKPDERFKALGGTSAGLLAFVSPDGVNWKRLQETPVFTQGIFDSQNVSFWSETENSYVCYFRTWTGQGYSGYRTVSRTTSKDFVHWETPQSMSFGETPSEHLYTNQTSPYFRAPHIYVGLAARFMPGRKVLSEKQAAEVGVHPRYFKDCSDSVLLTSRGGTVYQRTFMESLIRPGVGVENWVSRSNYLANGIVPTSPVEMSIYMSRRYGQPDAFIQRYSIRLDGFASLNAGYDGGSFLTKAMRFSANADESKKTEPIRMQINMSTSAAGSIRVAMMDENNQPIPGYSLSECDEIIGDQISRTVSWRQGENDLTKLAGKTIKIRFELKDADLYSFKID